MKDPLQNRVFSDIQILIRAINARMKTKASLLNQKQRMPARYPAIESGQSARV
jgi:hypothetical protein